jgi:hypothetical protein
MDIDNMGLKTGMERLDSRAWDGEKYGRFDWDIITAKERLSRLETPLDNTHNQINAIDLLISVLSVQSRQNVVYTCT